MTNFKQYFPGCNAKIIFGEEDSNYFERQALFKIRKLLT